MKRCIKAHDVDGFGKIPVGSLWEDDNPYITDDNADCFVDDGVPVGGDDEDPKPAKRTRKAVD